jgi:hypothetical protein
MLSPKCKDYVKMCIHCEVGMQTKLLSIEIDSNQDFVAYGVASVSLFAC